MRDSPFPEVRGGAEHPAPPTIVVGPHRAGLPATTHTGGSNRRSRCRRKQEERRRKKNKEEEEERNIYLSQKKNTATC